MKNEVIYPEKNYYSLSKDSSEDIIDENIIINMPAWDNGYFEVKLVSVFPSNGKKYLIPSLHVAYWLWDAKKGGISIFGCYRNDENQNCGNICFSFKIVIKRKFEYPTNYWNWRNGALFN